mmetsp:Transcript_71975/g.127215  ORF Transcript_71975/g.127215 Transcript_71975/m.127215 type:complete len:341 (+) Transcript_71975:79-1101(+)
MASRFGVGRRSGAAKSSPTPEADAEPISAATVPQGLTDLAQELKRKPTRCSVEVQTYTAKNWGGRHENEDRTMIAQDFYPDPRIAFHTIGVLDGHDTDSASDTVAKMLPGAVARRMKDGMPMQEAYTLAMAECEEQLKKVHATAGTCVCSCTIAGGVVWCANLGDCRAGLICLEESAASGAKAESITWMSRDHKASMAYERKRILDAGGQVNDGRVEGLEPSRTLGDFDVKLSTKPGVISIVPEVRQFELLPGENGRRAILVTGTDGVWDVITGQDICKLVAARKDLSHFFSNETSKEAPRAGVQALRDLAEDIVQFAVAKGSRDDCTCLAAFITVLPPE